MIEVTPRHARFYEQMLGFEQRGPERLNPSVNTLGVLLRLDLPKAERRAAELAGRKESERTEKTLFPYFLPEAEEQAIFERLKELR